MAGQAEMRAPGCPFCGAEPREMDPTNFPGHFEHPWLKRGCPLDGVSWLASDWNKRPISRSPAAPAGAVEAVVLADKLEKLMRDLRFDDQRHNHLRLSMFMQEHDTAILSALRLFASAATRAAQERRAAVEMWPRSRAMNNVIAERHRHVDVEGWTPEHDDQHDDGALARAAACYAIHGDEQAMDCVEFFDNLWPWSRNWWKPADRRRNLVKAAALLIAEIERIDRADGRALPLPGEEQKA